MENHTRLSAQNATATISSTAIDYENKEKEGLSQILCKHRRVVENRVHIFGRQRRRPLPPWLQRWRGRISRAASRLLTSGTVGVIPAYGLQYRRRSDKAGRFLFSMD